MVIVKDIANELLSFAAEQQRRFDSATLPSERKEQGHFGTPAAIAQFMAGMFSEIPSGTIRILDPGAGVGTLSAAFCQRILQQEAPRHVEIELWETNPRLVPRLRKTMEHCRSMLAEAGHRLDFTICVADFILANARATLFSDGARATFHFAILNPPYHKVRKESPQAQAMEHVVHGQPNVYAFFMAIAADLLAPEGEMVAITPRSYFNGPYFKKFRKWFFDRMTPRQIHVFESRSNAFREDDVLQENVILLAQKGANPQDVVLTTSFGRDLVRVEKCTAAFEKTIDNTNGDHVVRVATSRIEHQILEVLDSLPERFQSLGFEISTGPVVTFRSTKFLRDDRSKDTAPLLWMHNVRPFVTRFTSRNGKPNHIVVSEDSMRLLLPVRRYVLLKRFTAKEEKRRLVAGILRASDSYSEWIGLENHLNYIYRKRAELSEAEALGLAAFFNSSLVDRYFRAISGNTQVNATEIRAMPMPDAKTLAWIGKEAKGEAAQNLQEVERIVGRCLGLPNLLIEELCKESK